MKGEPQWEVEVSVRAPLGVAWNVIEDISLIPAYDPDVRHVAFLSGQARRTKGVRYKCEVPGGRRGWWVEEVVEHHPFERITLAFPEESGSGGSRAADFLTEISVCPGSSGETLLRLRAWYRPRGWLTRLANPLVFRRLLRNRARKSLEGLKRLVEQRAKAGSG